MSLIKKSDVKSHLSTRYRNRVHTPPVGQPGTGFSEASQAAVDGRRAGFSKDFTADHQRTPAVVVPIRDAADGTQTQVSPSFRPSKL
jgi:hypothetical protein